MPELDHQSAQSKAMGVSEQLSREETLRTVLESGRGGQLAARRAEVSRLRAIAEFHRLQRAALQVRAGLDGVVQEISLEAGMWVPRGTVLARIAEPGRLKARGKVAEAARTAKPVVVVVGSTDETPDRSLRLRVPRPRRRQRGYLTVQYLRAHAIWQLPQILVACAPSGTAHWNRKLAWQSLAGSQVA